MAESTVCAVDGCERERDHSRFCENFELWTTSQPKGQRVEDKLAWARAILAEYDGLAR